MTTDSKHTETLIDTHAHVYVKDFDDQEEVLLRAQEAHIAAICMPNIDGNTIDNMHAAERSSGGYCQSMMGLHPCSVGEDWKTELATMEAHWSQRDYIAVGEIGLDYHWDLTSVREQQLAFERQLAWAREVGRPVVIHSRKSWKETIDTVRRLQDGRLRGVFHCFGESRDLLDQIKDLGFYVGIGGVFTFRKVSLREQINKSDLENIVLETDSPYLSPEPYRSKRNEPQHLTQIANAVADSLGLSLGEIARKTTQNAQELFPEMGIWAGSRPPENSRHEK